MKPTLFSRSRTEHSINMNIKFTYLYRDGANYKNYNELIFDNDNARPKEQIETMIMNSLVDEMWFVAKDWNLPDMHFQEYPWDSEIDHDWHEFDTLEETSELATENIPIEDFLNLIQNKKAE